MTWHSGLQALWLGRALCDVPSPLCAAGGLQLLRCLPACRSYELRGLWCSWLLPACAVVLADVNTLHRSGTELS